MWTYVKRLQYPVKIKNTNPKLAQIVIAQYGGPKINLLYFPKTVPATYDFVRNPQNTSKNMRQTSRRGNRTEFHGRHSLSPAQ